MVDRESHWQKFIWLFLRDVGKEKSFALALMPLMEVQVREVRLDPNGWPVIGCGFCWLN